MRVLRNTVCGAALVGAMTAAVPAAGQFFLQPKNMAGEPVKGDEPGIAILLPGATSAERRAGLVWTMRAALNVAALQCQFEPTLLTVGHYNSILLDHGPELKNAFDTLARYYVRTSKTKAIGQSALDQYGTRTYSAFATVAAQRNFCETAHMIGRDAVFTPRGKFGELAEARMRELRNSLTPYGEQLFPRYMALSPAPTPMPRLESICWNKKGQWVSKKCGAMNWPPAGVGMAAR
ncbi:hypothetical protein [Sphingomonas sp.]|jgi:hypothetical protein|uniref:hypothetical protein n=1 Tax=Sphingomonas sp. TaxID=28214 RepID=UPI002ED7ED32